MNLQLFFITSILFFACFIRSAFGFGQALIAVPLLAFVMPVEQAAPLAVLISITMAVLIIIQDWREVHFGSAGRLFASTAVGIPLGLWLLKTVDSTIATTSLAVVIILFSLYCLLWRMTVTLPDDRHAWGFGFLAGILGGAYGMNGPPLVVYGALRRWTPQDFRATLQGYFLPASLLSLIGYASTGLWNQAVSHYYLWSLGPSVLACVLGRMVNRRMEGPGFLRWVYLGLLVTGLLLLIRSLT